MSSRGVPSVFVWVERSPQGPGTPPGHAAWRRHVAASVVPRRSPVIEVGLDFVLEPTRVAVGLDRLVRLTLGGLRDAGTLPRGLVGIEALVATKRVAPAPGVGVSLVFRRARMIADDPFDGRADLDVTADHVPRAGSATEREAWREVVAAAWRQEPVQTPVGVDIAVAKETSLATMLGSVIDGLEPYLGRTAGGRARLRPNVEQMAWLRITRLGGLSTALRVRAGTPPPAGIGRTVPPRPSLPVMDPDYPFSMSDHDAVDARLAWGRLFEK